MESTEQTPENGISPPHENTNGKKTPPAKDKQTNHAEGTISIKCGYDDVSLSCQGRVSEGKVAVSSTHHLKVFR